jgi:hypothetical protein
MPSPTMSAARDQAPGSSGDDPAERLSAWVRRHRAAAALIAAAGILGLFFGYLRMSRTVSINADGASNAIQAWDMIHGNPLLRGWTVTDVSFYTTELLQYVLVELVYGYHADVIHAAAAMTYTLALLLAAILAKGRATGRQAVVRVAVAVAIMLVPGPMTGYTIVLGSPAHFGTSVPLLVTWLLLDRAGTGRDGSPRDRVPRWLACAVAVLLAWGTVADPLVMYVGALPLAVVSLVRMAGERRFAPRRWRGPDAHLLLAAVASVALARAFLATVRLAGGFHVHAPIAEFAPLSKVGTHVWLLIRTLAVLFGAYFPDLPGPLGVAVGVLNLAGIVLVTGALAVVTIRTVRTTIRGRGWSHGDRVTQVLACAIGVNLCAFVASTLPTDLMSTRQIAVVLPLGAALAGRVLAHRLAAPRLVPALAGALLVLACAFVVRAADRPVVENGHDVGQWLASRNLTHGIGSYWGANIVTLNTGGRVTVAPTIGVGDRIMGYRWESRADWYDPARHDARFLVLDLDNPGYGTEANALRQFGTPVERKDFGRFAVLVYGHNLLVDLPAFCVPEVAQRMADCP